MPISLQTSQAMTSTSMTAQWQLIDDRLSSNGYSGLDAFVVAERLGAKKTSWEALARRVFTKTDVGVSGSILRKWYLGHPLLVPDEPTSEAGR